MRRERWKCAKEQVRSATREEEETYGLLKDEFKELQAELGRKGSKRGFKDISNWQFPPTAEDEPPQDTEEPVERPAQSRRLEHLGQEDSESPGPLSQEEHRHLKPQHQQQAAAAAPAAQAMGMRKEN
jgi:hypothetical protein